MLRLSKLLHHTLVAVAVATASMASAEAAHAQEEGQSTTTLAPGKPTASAFNKVIFGSQMHTYVYGGAISSGTTINVTARWTKKPHDAATLTLVISDPGSDTPAEKTVNYTPADGNGVTASKTFASSGPVQIYVITNAAGFTGDYEVTVIEGAATSGATMDFDSGERSQTHGFHFAGGWNTTTFKSQFSTETGQGQGGRIGMGFGPLLFYGELQQSEMENESGDPADAYTLTQRELGARLYLLGKGSRIRPFAQYAYGFRRLSSVETSVEGEGVATTPGAGVAFYPMKRLSIEGAWTRSTGEVDRARASSDDDWSDLPDEFIVRGPSTRITVQMVLHL